MPLQNPNRVYEQPYNILHSNQYYGGQIPGLHIDPVQSQPWMSSQQPRSVHGVRDRRSSSSASVHTSKTTSQAKGSGRMNYYQTNLSPLDSVIGSSVPRGFPLFDPKSVSSYYESTASRGPESAWSPYNLRVSQSGGAYGPSQQPNVNYRFTSGPRSDVDSQALLSDEGYFSRNTRSVMSNEPNHVNQELPASLMSHINDMHVESVASEAPTMSRMPSDQRSRVSSRSGRSKRDLSCPECSEVLKCNSEFKKHMLKHSKPFKCDVPDCKRTEGFTTTNDLERHQKSIHRKDIDKKSYQCAVENCRNKEKIWPRLDNFKQHVERMHKYENIQDVIQRSIWYPKPFDSPIDDKSTVTLLDIDLTVAGMEIPFSVSPTMGNISMSEFPTVKDSLYTSSNEQPLSRLSRGGPTSAPHHTRIQKVPKVTRSRHHAPGMSAERTQTSFLTTQASTGAFAKSSLKLQQSLPSSSLSNAPQTKAEQQRLELKKKFERRLHSPEPVDLESHILELIRKVKDEADGNDVSGNRPKPNKNDALLKMMADLVNKGSGSSDIGQSRSSKSPSNNDKKCPKPDCGFAVARDCDLRKHLKRHNRPYGCTYPKCHKRFGAKSDWKRHENSQHFQQEAFRCSQKVQTGQICGVHLYREAMFKSHLQMEHKVPREDAQGYVESSRIGKNCQGSFWCGLCKEVVPLKELRNAAWDERFDHIAHHFEREKRSIDDWICAEENRPKQELLEEKRNRKHFDDENEREQGGDVDAPGEVVDDVPQADNMHSMSMQNHAAMLRSPFAGGIAPEAGQKRPRPEDSAYSERHLKRRQATIITYCCACQSPCGAMDVACANCAHRPCDSCSIEETFMMDDGF